MAFRHATLKLVSLAALTAAAIAPVPSFARASAPDADLAEMQDKLNDPHMQDAIGDALAGMMAAMMQIKAAPFARAMEKMGDTKGVRAIPEGATMGDLAGPGAREMPREVARKVPAMMGAMGAMAGAFQEMLPQLEAMGKRMEGAMDRADRRTD